MKPNTTNKETIMESKNDKTQAAASTLYNTTDKVKDLWRKTLNFESDEQSVEILAALLPYTEAAETDPETLAREFIKTTVTERAALCKMIAMERVMLTTHDYEMLRDLIMTQQDQIAALQTEVKALRQQLAGKGQG